MEAPRTRWVNPSVLKWARERFNLNPAQVAEESQKLSKRHYASLSADDLAAWEAGLYEPDLVHLETLSEIYQCPVGYFFLDSPPDESLPLSFRGLAEEKDLSPNTLRTLRRFYELARWTADFLEGLDISWEGHIRPGEHPLDLSRVDSIVQEERNRFGWTDEVRSSLTSPEEAFRWWRRAVEGKGVFCFEMKLDPNEVRGASLWIRGRYPFILVNHRDMEAASGRIFTLLHEYAHLITAEEGIVCDFRGLKRGQTPEPFGNRFAARMLLPFGELQARLRELGEERYQENWSDRLLDEIRQPFMVSRDVIAVALQEMGLAPQDFYERKREQWGKRWGKGGPWLRKGGARPTKKELKRREIGHSLTALLVQYSKHPRFPWLDVARVLDMKVEKVEDFIQWALESKL